MPQEIMDKYLALVKLESSGENLVLTGDRAKLLAASSSTEQVPIPVIIPVHTIDQTFFHALTDSKSLSWNCEDGRLCTASEKLKLNFTRHACETR